MQSCCFANLRLLKLVSGYFWKLISFYPFSKNAHPHVASSNRIHTKTLKRCNYDSIPYWACVMPWWFLMMYFWCMTSSYSKSSVFVRSHLIEKPAFWKISTLESVFEKMRFGWPFSLDSCGRSVGQTGGEKSPFSNKNGYVWTGPNSYCFFAGLWDATTATTTRTSKKHKVELAKQQVCTGIFAVTARVRRENA